MSTPQPPRPTQAGRAPVALITAGSFIQGDDHHYPEEAPTRTVHVDAFTLDVHPVTNAQFAEFVAATGYVAQSERGGLAVFVPTGRAVDLAQPSLWWRHAPDASWRCPRGTSVLCPELADHPVVGVTTVDASRYAAWAGGRLPTESEWEWAASGGMSLPPTWPLAADGMLLANVWLGEFPWHSVRAAPPGTMPVGSFPPNHNGLYDMLGNVWELTADAWTSGRVTGTPCCAGEGPGPDTCPDTGPDTGPGDGSGDSAVAVVAKGGSFLCAANYCTRYRPAARHRQAVDEATCHIGFRCAYDPGTAERQ